MKHILSLSRPQAMDIRRQDGTRSHGADQDWYTLPWRQRAGCGPTTASAQMAYLAALRPSLAALCPLEGREQGAFVTYMDKVWEYVTPGSHGLNRVEMYTDGVARFCGERGVKLLPRALEVPTGEERPGFDRCVSFIRAGLEADCPVAFLNLDNGEVEALDKWHWVLLSVLEEGDAGTLVTVVDNGNTFSIDLKLWYDTARDLGGFVWLEELN